MGIHEAFESPPPKCGGCDVTFPEAHIMLATINRPRQLNSIPYALHWEMDALFKWFDNEPSLRVAIITGTGNRAFCVGSDLIEMERVKKSGDDSWKAEPYKYTHPTTGFAGLSRREGKKPVVAAVNGYALGGGWEIVLNCDVVIAARNAQFGLPEAKVGLYAYGGGLPRLIRTAGLHVASEIALSGRSITAEEALQRNLVNYISKKPETLIDEAIEIARGIAAVSPDAMIITRSALREAWEIPSVERAFQNTHERFYEKMMAGENSSEGLAAFREKRPPRWKPSKL
ncbi:Carnitinyl-CoA dehydratase [Fonsecaea pedrosoi]|nr:Carnitinyl-CoA dehydratase [Fonsecaea pedrosoi]